MRLVTIIGTRPEIIRLACIINKADECFDHILVHTGQNWDKNLNDIFFEELGIRKPDYFLNSVGKNLGETIGNIISKSYDLFTEIKPDALLVLGDTNSGLSVISAKRLKIPIFHMEAGQRCFDLMVPEEINRKIIDHTSDINLCYSENARRNLVSEGFKKEHLFVTGSPLTEVLAKFSQNINNSKILTKLNLKERNYILLSLHREENIDIPENFIKVIDSVNKLGEKYQIPIIFSTHPRTKKKLTENNISLNENIFSMVPFGLFDYCKLQINAICVLSDSGSLFEEAALLHFPAVSFRTSNERQETIDKGNVIMGNLNAVDVLSSVELAIKLFEPNTKIKILPSDYIDENVSSKIIKIVQGYAPIVNKYVWFRN